VSAIEPSSEPEAPDAAPPLEQAQRELWSLEKLNHHYVEWVMNQVSRDKVRAAAILGVNVSTLYRWLRSRSIP
jgi:two-component system response regulator HydG